MSPNAFFQPIPTPRPSKKGKMGSVFCLAVTALLWTASATASQALSLSQALAEVYPNQPALKACQQELKALENQARSAGLLENPQVELLGEDFLGNAAGSNQNYMQFTLSANQKLPLGGRLSQQSAVFQRQWDAQTAQCALRKRLFDQGFSVHFLAVLQQQESLALTQDMHSRAQQLLKQTERLIEVGKITRLERTFPATEVARLAIEVEQKQRALELSRQTLFSYFASPPKAEADLSPPWKTPFPPLPERQTLLEAHPLYRERQLQVKRAQQEQELAQARFWPDLSLGSGLRWHPQSQEWGVNLSLGVPLQIFSAPSLGVELAQIRLEQAQFEREALRQELERELQQLLSKFQHAQVRETRYREQLLPLAEAHLEQVHRLLNAGKITVLQVLQAQQQVLQLQSEALQARQERNALYLSLALWQGNF